MATEFRLPELGENIKSGDVSRVLVSVGDTVAEGQPLLELETDKAAIEVPAPVSGTLKEIHVKAGQKVDVGQLILTLEPSTDGKGERDEAESGARDARREETRTQAEVEPEQEAKEARRADSIGAEGEMAGVVPKGEVKKEQEADGAGIVRRHEAVPVQEREGDAGPSARGDMGKLRLVEPLRAQVQSHPAVEPAPAAPSVRRTARELGVDINQVPGSGPAGRISIEDVKNFARSLIVNRGGSKSVEQAATSPLPDFRQWGEVERKPMSSVRRKTAEHMHRSWSTIPHVTQFDKVDITELEQLRVRFGQKAEAGGGKLTVTAIILKVIASALRVFPQFNASLDMARSEIIFKKYFHIGVAVDTDRGLLVPVIRDVGKKNILDVSVELSQMADKARNKKLTLEEMQGGTFTITNLGGIGGTHFSPIVNAPEVAILGVSRASTEAVFIDGKFEPRLMLPLSLSYDHRLIDGADAVRFLRWIVEALEEPFLLALEG
jgi:pyruvate dehydrogenase E2 component (dihydrolipoamide acetyltransferase)